MSRFNLRAHVHILSYIRKVTPFNSVVILSLLPLIYFTINVKVMLKWYLSYCRIFFFIYLCIANLKLLYMKTNEILIRLEYCSTKRTTLRTLNTLANEIGDSLVKHLYTKFDRSQSRKKSYPRVCNGNKCIITFIYR